MFAQLINRINRTAPDESPADGMSTAVDSFADGAADVAPEQRDLIHMAIDWVDAPLAFFDRRLVVQFANAACCALAGRPRDRLVGQSIDDALGELTGGDESYARRALAGESVDVDLAHRHDGVLDGVSRVQYRPQRDADGDVVGALCVLHRLGRRRADQADAANEAADGADGALDRALDTALLPLGGATVNAPLRVALRLAQDDVAERERKQRELIESLPLPLVFIGNDGRCKWGNAAFSEAFDLADDEIAGVTASGLAGLPEATTREGLATANSGRSHSVEAELSLGSGPSRWYRIDFVPGFDRDDVQNGVYVLLSDITESRHALMRLREAEARTVEEERRAERAVRERDERIRFLTDNLPAHIVYLDADLRVQYGNSRFLADHRMARLDEAIGKSPEELINAKAAAQVRRMSAAAMRGERVGYEWPMSDDPAEQRWVSVSISGDFDDDRRPRGVYIIAYDISDSKRSESNRLRQQRLIEAFIENFPQPLAYLDPQGVHRHTNRAYEEFIDRSKADIVGLTGVAVFGRDIAADFDRPFQQALVGQRAHAEHAVSLAGAPKRFLSSDWLPDVDAAGAVRGVYLIVQDINEAKKARLAYEESLREMQRAMDSVALPISFVDRDERLRFVNRATTTWHGRPAEELIGMRLADLMSGDDYRFAKPYIDAALSGESVQYEREMRYHDGARRWVLIRYVATRDERDAVTGFYTTATDIQARKKHEIALQQANGLLTAHFENTPLASFTLDEARRITRWSSQAETLFGWRRDEAIERTVRRTGSRRRRVCVRLPAARRRSEHDVRQHAAARRRDTAPRRHDGDVRVAHRGAAQRGGTYRVDARAGPGRLAARRGRATADRDRASRHADAPPEPQRARADAARVHRARAAERHRRRRDVPRPRPFQEHQRHARPSRRRPDADRGRGHPASQRARRGPGRAHRRRRVHGRHRAQVAEGDRARDRAAHPRRAQHADPRRQPAAVGHVVDRHRDLSRITAGRPRR